jgi:hypothetical protein
MMSEASQPPAGEDLPSFQQIVAGMRASPTDAVQFPVGFDRDPLASLHAGLKSLDLRQSPAIGELQQPEQVIVIGVRIATRPEPQG